MWGACTIFPWQMLDVSLRISFGWRSDGVALDAETDIRHRDATTVATCWSIASSARCMNEPRPSFTTFLRRLRGQISAVAPSAGRVAPFRGTPMWRCIDGRERRAPPHPGSLLSVGERERKRHAFPANHSSARVQWRSAPTRLLSREAGGPRLTREIALVRGAERARFSRRALVSHRRPRLSCVFSIPDPRSSCARKSGS